MRQDVRAPQDVLPTVAIALRDRPEKLAVSKSNAKLFRHM
jgi:hypothetical protein